MTRCSVGGVCCETVINAPPGLWRFRCRALLGLDGRGRPSPHGPCFCKASSFFSQVAARKADEDVFQAGLSGGEVQKLSTLVVDRIQQGGNGSMGLAHV